MSELVELALKDYEEYMKSKEIKNVKLDDIVKIDSQVNALVDSETGHQAMLMIDMCSQGTHTIGRKYMILIIHNFVYLDSYYKSPY